LRGSRVMVLDMSGRRILVVEDEPLIALDIAQALESAGASVLVAASLDEGLRLAEQDGLSAAVLDLVLGANDGAALCARLRERAIPFVIYSGRTDIPVGCEAEAIVPKPSHPQALLQAIANVLATHWWSSAGALAQPRAGASPSLQILKASPQLPFHSSTANRNICGTQQAATCQYP